MSINVVVPLSKLKEVRDRLPSLLDDIVRGIGRRLQTEGKSLLESELGRFQTGAMASSFKAYVSQDANTGYGEVRMQIGPNFDPETGFNYTRTVLEIGSPGWEIDQRALGRKWPMRWSHAASRVSSGVGWHVKHPGQRARTDIIEALKELARQVAAEELMSLVLLGAI